MLVLNLIRLRYGVPPTGPSNGVAEAKSAKRRESQLGKRSASSPLNGLGRNRPNHSKLPENGCVALGFAGWHTGVFTEHPLNTG
jgi:hypothetical protein